MSVYSLVFPERRCLHLNPAPTSGRPTERGVAFREVEPHAECQVQVYSFLFTYIFFNHLSNSLFSPFCQSTFQHFDPTKLKIGTKMLSSQINLCFGVCAGFMLLMLISRSFEFLCDVTQLPFLYCLHSLPLSHYPPINTG